MATVGEFKDAWGLLSTAMRIPVGAQIILLRTMWVMFVTFHILWVCGWLTILGMSSPFASAGELAKAQHAIDLSATIAVARELRDEYVILCREKDPATKAGLYHYIEELQTEYVALTKSRYPEPVCQS